MANKDLRRCATAYDCREDLPELSRWLSADELKLIPIYQGARFKAGEMYLDLDHPERGPFVATGEEAPISDYTYTVRTQVPERIWAKLATWGNPVTSREAEAIVMTERDLAIGQEQSAAGEARPEYPE